MMVTAKSRYSLWVRKHYPFLLRSARALMKRTHLKPPGLYPLAFFSRHTDLCSLVIHLQFHTNPRRST